MKTSFHSIEMETRGSRNEHPIVWFEARGTFYAMSFWIKDNIHDDVLVSVDKRARRLATGPTPRLALMNPASCLPYSPYVASSRLEGIPRRFLRERAADVIGLISSCGHLSGHALMHLRRDWQLSDEDIRWDIVEEDMRRYEQHKTAMRERHEAYARSLQDAPMAA